MKHDLVTGILRAHTFSQGGTRSKQLSASIFGNDLFNTLLGGVIFFKFLSFQK